MTISEHDTPNLSEAAQRIFVRTDFHNNPYLRSLRDGSLPLAAFRRSQEQFFFAVTFFSRLIAVLVGRMPDPRQRMILLHNLVEEHGDFNEQFFHHTTFQQFLQRLDVDPLGLPGVALWPEVRAFNCALSGACALDDVEVGIACMGMIEYSFADISSEIGRGVCERGWLTTETLTHYKFHSEIDKRHASEFFVLIESAWSNSLKRYLIEQGLELGAYVFDRLYKDLHSKALSLEA
jgi:pyrroloquinoline-quinone synthase